MKSPVMKLKRVIEKKRLVVLICLVTLSALPISTTKPTTLQEGNDAATQNAKGLELYRSGKFEEAIRSFKEAIKLKKDYAEAYRNLGDACFQLAQYKKAIDAYEEAAKFQPNPVMVYNIIGTSYYRLAEYKKAIEAYKQAIRLGPKEAMPHYNLATVYGERGNQKAALEEYRVLKGIDPELAEKLLFKIAKPTVPVFDSGAVRLRVIVEDANGVPVKDLNQDDFQVSEEGIAQTISSFSKDQVPLVYALTVDNSASIRPAIALLIEACKGIIKDNLPGDETLIVRFVSSDKVETFQEFTSEQEMLNKGLDFYIEAGPSAIRDAVYLSAQRVAQYRFPDSHLQRAIILLTDGDERDSYYSMDDLLKLLRSIDVKVFVISLATESKKGAKLNVNQPKRAVDLLKQLASETGGQAFFPKSAEELQAMIVQMMNLIRSEYVIEYKPANSVEPGKYRHISISLVARPEREKWTNLTRPGYVIAEK